MSKRSFSIGLLTLLSMALNGWPAVAQETESKKIKEPVQETQQEKSDVPAALDFTVKSIDGEDVKLSDYDGKVVMIVNVASYCGRTKQYADLQALFEKYGDQGFVVLGFPCNQFGEQEPGTEAEIKTFCSSKYNVSFPMFSKIDVKGDGQCELYKHLTGLNLQPKGKSDVEWNFEKIILSKSGEPIARFASGTSPSSDEVVKVIETALGAK